MEIVERTLRDRVEQALVVFLILFAFQYFQNEIDWMYLIAVAVIFFVIMIPFDAIRHEFEG